MNKRKIFGAAGIVLAGLLVGGCADAGAVEDAATAVAEVSYEPTADVPQVDEADLPSNAAEVIYLEEVPVHWFAALADYGRDWACTVTSTVLPGQRDAMQVTQHLIGLSIDEIYSIPLELDQPDMLIEMSDVVCQNSIGEELVVPGTPGFTFDGEPITTASLLGTANASDTAIAVENIQPEIEDAKISDLIVENPVIADEINPVITENSLSEFELAVAELEHSLLMAEEVRLVFQDQVNLVENARPNGPELRVGERATEQHNWDVAHLANVTEAINATEIQFQQIMVDAAADEVQAIVELSELRDSLVNVIEPFGPWENPKNLPASWLALLPNGDPRNLPRVSVVGVGPESVSIAQEFNRTVTGNDGLPHSSEIYIVRMVCNGPRIGDSRDSKFPSGLAMAHCKWDFIGNGLGGVFRGASFGFNSNTGLFENHLSNALSPDPIRMIAFRCLQLRPNVDSELFPDGIDLTRDDDGFLVFELLDVPMCTDNPDHWLNLMPSGGNAGHYWLLNLDD